MKKINSEINQTVANPKVTVIISVFNEENFIKKSLESVINQSLKEIEIIVVDDGSTDNTLKILNTYAKNDSRIKIISHKNIGLGASRNKAIRLATGEYLAFLDGDDWLAIDAMEISYNEAKDKNTQMTIFQMINYDNKTNTTYENDWFNLNNLDESFDDCVFNSNKTKDFLFDLSVSACQKIYKTSFLKDINAKFPEGIYFEDMPFFFYVYLKAERVSIIRQHFYYRRKHDASITHVVDDKYFDTVEAGDVLFNIFINNGFYEDYKKDLIAYKINGPRMALMDIKSEFKEQLFDLIKEDYEKIKITKYYNDFLANLGPIKRKFFLNVLKANDYSDFKKLKDTEVY